MNSRGMMKYLGLIAIILVVFTGKSTLAQEDLIGTHIPDSTDCDPAPQLHSRGDRIAFSSNMDGDSEIYTVNPDGTDLQQLTTNSVSDRSPAWSPDGTQIAYAHDSNLYIMNADGSNNTQISDIVVTGSLDWAPNGELIAFTSSSNIYVVDLQTLVVTNLTNSSISQYNADPKWSPDGTQIAYVSNGDLPPVSALDAQSLDIFIMNADGSNKTRISLNDRGLGVAGLSALNWYSDNQIIYSSGFYQSTIFSVNVLDGVINQLTNLSLSAGLPSVSPDHQQIVYIQSGQLTIMNVDGTNPEVIITGIDNPLSPAW